MMASMKVDRGKCSRACSREPACSHCFPKCVSRVPATIRAARYVGSEIMENVCLSVFFHIFPRWTEKDPPALAEASCFPDVTENISPFVENQINGVIRGYWLGDSIGGCFFFFHEGSEYPVPDDKGGTVVLIQVFLVTGVVDAVMRWCGEDVFNEGRELSDILCVDPELIQDGHLVANEEDKRIKPNHNHRYKEDKLDVLRPAEAE